jgi:L-ascorbate metabolism protein UlaG (beta-lactamase superfamily)
MIKTSRVLGMLFAGALFMAARLQTFEEDIFKTSKGDLKITFIGHGTLMFAWDGKIIHVDPVGRYADYATLPKADLILVTHEHGDHLDLKAIEAIKKPATEILAAEVCKATLPAAGVLKNGDVRDLQGIKIEAVPAYNISAAFHPKGRGNGYILTFADKRVLVAGDTENIPEFASFKSVDIAFLPMNLPYTMSVEMAAAAARIIKPKVLYPYHFGTSDTAKLVELLKDTPGIEVRIRKLG